MYNADLLNSHMMLEIAAPQEILGKSVKQILNAILGYIDRVNLMIMVRQASALKFLIALILLLQTTKAVIWQFYMMKMQFFRKKWS